MPVPPPLRDPPLLHRPGLRGAAGARGAQIENPFVVLPLEAFCRAIKANVQTQVRGAPVIPAARLARDAATMLLVADRRASRAAGSLELLPGPTCGCTPEPHFALKRLVGTRLAFPPCGVQELGVS